MWLLLRWVGGVLDGSTSAWRALLVFINRGLPQLERTLKAHDLLVVHYSILVALSSAPDETLRLSDLADSANLSQSRLTHRLRTLVDRDIVDISPDRNDGRGKNATLTERGRRLLEAVAPLHAEDVQRLLFDQLSASETAHLATAFSRVAAELCEHEAFLPHRL